MYTLEDMVTKHVGPRGTPAREHYEFELQMSVFGALIRSVRLEKKLTQDELGALKIGNNVTDYAWDGRDEFGDQLANGVYLYKVFIRQNGENIELRSSGGDRGFKNGYGKLYLLR